MMGVPGSFKPLNAKVHRVACARSVPSENKSHKFHDLIITFYYNIIVFLI